MLQVSALILRQHRGSIRQQVARAPAQHRDAQRVKGTRKGGKGALGSWNPGAWSWRGPTPTALSSGRASNHLRASAKARASPAATQREHTSILPVPFAGTEKLTPSREKTATNVGSGSAEDAAGPRRLKAAQQHERWAQRPPATAQPGRRAGTAVSQPRTSPSTRTTRLRKSTAWGRHSGDRKQEPRAAETARGRNLRNILGDRRGQDDLETHPEQPAIKVSAQK